MKNKKKPIPVFKTDEEAEKFVDTADLSEYDLSGFRPGRFDFSGKEPQFVPFEFSNKDARLTMRLPGALLAAVRAKAEARGIPYQRFIREALEKAV